MVLCKLYNIMGKVIQLPLNNLSLHIKIRYIYMLLKHVFLLSSCVVVQIYCTICVVYNVFRKSDHWSFFEYIYSNPKVHNPNLINNQLDVQFLCIYFTSLHVSSNPVLIIRRISCTNTTSGICQSF
jgi:hypothetical protein